MDTPLVIFLDFDGVLHHFFPVPGVPDTQNAHFAFLPLFEASVRHIIGIRRTRPVEIVIASSWRHNYDLAQLKDRFSPDIANLIVGQTPAHANTHEPGSRLGEVQAWLALHGREHAHWVALDDMPDMYGPNVPLIVCPDVFGWQQASELIAAATNYDAWLNTRVTQDHASASLTSPPQPAVLG